jgi:hypothetical protein
MTTILVLAKHAKNRLTHALQALARDFVLVHFGEIIK